MSSWPPHLHNYFIVIGVAVGGGWQALVAYINLGCYYILGIPLGYLLGYKANLGVQVNFSLHGTSPTKNC